MGKLHKTHLGFYWIRPPEDLSSKEIKLDQIVAVTLTDSLTMAVLIQTVGSIPTLMLMVYQFTKRGNKIHSDMEDKVHYLICFYYFVIVFAIIIHTHWLK